MKKNHMYWIVALLALVVLIGGCEQVTGGLEEDSDSAVDRGLVSGNTAYNHNDYFSMGGGRYYLNNQWGMHDTNREKDGSWQKIVYTPSNGKYSVEYNLWTKDQGNDMVLGYPSILNGWHYGQANPSDGKCGFPVRIYDDKDIMTSWSVSHQNWANWECYNVAYDIWIGGINETNPSKPDTEVMIWLQRKNQAPLGSKVKTISRWGTKWDFYASYPGQTGNPGWTVYSFVRQSGTWSVSNKNISDFINYLWNNNYLDGRKYIVGVEAGQEICQGKGKFVNNSFSLSVK